MTVVRKADKPEASWRPGKRGIMHAAASVGATDRLLVNESWNEPGVGAPTHVHPDGLEEIIMVLEGTGDFWSDGEHWLLEAGDSIVMRPYTHHGFVNVGEDTLHVLGIFSSATAPTIYDDEPDRVVYLGGTRGARLDSQRTVERVSR